MFDIIPSNNQLACNSEIKPVWEYFRSSYRFNPICAKQAYTSDYSWIEYSNYWVSRKYEDIINRILINDHSVVNEPLYTHLIGSIDYMNYNNDILSITNTIRRIPEIKFNNTVLQLKIREANCFGVIGESKTISHIRANNTGIREYNYLTSDISRLLKAHGIPILMSIEETINLNDIIDNYINIWTLP